MVVHQENRLDRLIWHRVVHHVVSAEGVGLLSPGIIPSVKELQNGRDPLFTISEQPTPSPSPSFTARQRGFGKL
jgi:hypothetical protein